MTPMNPTNTASPPASRSPPALVRLVLALGAALAAFGAPALAQAQAPPSRSEAEHLVPPQGSAAEVPVHAGAVCILSFPEKLSPRAISSSSDFEIQPWREDGVAVRVVNDQAAPSTLALATVTGLIKVNVTLRVVPPTEPALTLVRFKAVSEAEAFDAQVKAGIAQRVAPIEQRLAAMRKELEALIRRRSDRQIAERLLRRGEVVKLKTHARNRDHVILHVWRGLLLGDDGYLSFEIENRSGAPYRLASVRVIADGRNVAGDVHLTTTTPTRDPALIGVVAPGATARGIVAIRPVQAVLRRPLALEVGMPNGRGTVRIERGIVLR